MNYRHAFHAGNFADVVKHLVLTHVIAHMAQKPAPFRVIDTHAGTGLYDLTGEEALRTGEWREGIARVMTATPPSDVAEVIAPYLDVLASDVGHDGALARYPGSPLIARRLMRSQDRLIANELHPIDRERLADLFHHDRQVKVMGLDGYVALKALLPPKERRGVVLIDPPFEVAGEYDRLATAVLEAQKRFATGTLILWYPIKARDAVDAFHRRLAQSELPKTLAVELAVTPTVAEDRGLAASGVVVINPPYRLDQKLEVALPWLASMMARAPGARTGVTWLVQEGT